MKLKICSCGKVQTTKNAKFVTRDDGLGLDALYFNCRSCGSTFAFVSKADRAQIEGWKQRHSRDSRTGIFVGLWTSMIVLALAFVVGCGAGGGGGAAAGSAANDPSGQAPMPFEAGASYTRDQAAPAYAPCPICIKTCDNTPGFWFCQYTNSIPPAVCPWPVIGSIQFDQTGTITNLWGMTLGFGNGDFHGGNAMNYSNATMTYSGNQLSFPDIHNYGIPEFDIQVDQYTNGSDDGLIVTFGAGCSIFFKKSLVAPVRGSPNGLRVCMLCCF